MKTFISLGDSMSIDRYPDLDHADRQRLRLPASGLGAASLLARNNDEVWPEFAGRDLATRYPGIDCHFLAVDGATTEDVLESQIVAIDISDAAADGTITPVADLVAWEAANDPDAADPGATVDSNPNGVALLPDGGTLVTDAGGNDLLSLIGATDHAGQEGVSRILDNLDAILRAVSERLPRAVMLVANVYDPTDGTGDLEGHRLRLQEMRWLRDYNGGVEDLCARRQARLIDVYGHFAGHGRSAPAADRWYWAGSLIEPGVIGASELRRLWLAALDDEKLTPRTPRPGGR